MHDLNAFEIAQAAPRGAARVDEFIDMDCFSEGVPATEDERPILVIRSGAIGDLLMLSPALAALKAQSGRQVVLSCWPAHFEIFAGNKFLDEIVSYPVDARTLEKYSQIVSLENTMESDHSQHATDVFAKALGLKPPLPSYKPFYVVLDEEKKAVKEKLFTGRPNLAVHPRASVANRDYPQNQWLEVIVKLERAGWGVLLFGTRGQLPPIPVQFQTPFIRNLADQNLTLRQSAAVLAQCDAFVGVDSGLLHLCHALDIPAVGIFGAFPWQIRTAHAPKTWAISGTGECAGCCWHMHAGRMFPPNKPCSTARHCVVLASISPQRIVDRVNLLKP